MKCIVVIYIVNYNNNKEWNFTCFRWTKLSFLLLKNKHILLQIPPSVVEELELCNAQMNYKSGELKNIIWKLAEVLANQTFVDQMLEINDDICRISLWQTDNGVDNMAAVNKMADADNEDFDAVVFDSFPSIFYPNL